VPSFLGLKSHGEQLRLRVQATQYHYSSINQYDRREILADVQ
jgi:hypothetical protein